MPSAWAMPVRETVESREAAATAVKMRVMKGLLWT
jgi:hypothetical protein